VAAHSFLDGRRSWNLSGLAEYMQAAEEGLSTLDGWEEIDPRTALQERVWMRLRTDRGIELSEAERGSLEGGARFRDLLEAGFFELSPDRLRLTHRGMALADALGVEICEILEKSRARSEKVDRYGGQTHLPGREL
jgi:coproporphyrinogen III oxidase-like Fe-S oxidoreductase